MTETNKSISLITAYTIDSSFPFSQDFLLTSFSTYGYKVIQDVDIKFKTV